MSDEAVKKYPETINYDSACAESYSAKEKISDKPDIGIHSVYFYQYHNGLIDK